VTELVRLTIGQAILESASRHPQAEGVPIMVTPASTAVALSSGHDVYITNLQFDIRELNAQIANLPNDIPGRVAKAHLRSVIGEKSQLLEEALRQIVLARKEAVSDLKLEELKGEYRARRAEFLGAAEELMPTFEKLVGEYKALEKDEE